jgi:hypothetical protein
MEGSEEELGPVDAVLIGYGPGAPMTGEAIPMLLGLVDHGIIRALNTICAQGSGCVLLGV